MPSHEWQSEPLGMLSRVLDPFPNVLRVNDHVRINEDRNVPLTRSLSRSVDRRGAVEEASQMVPLKYGELG